MNMFEDIHWLRLIQAAGAGLGIGGVFVLGYSLSYRLQNNFKFNSNPDLPTRLFVIGVGSIIYVVVVLTIFFLAKNTVGKRDGTFSGLILFGVCAIVVIVWAFRSKFIPPLIKD
jgi:hypothetical protein